MFNPVYHKEKTREVDLYSERAERGYAAKTVGLHFEKLTKILDKAILDGDKRTAFAVLSILFKVFRRPSLSLIHSGLTMLWGRKDVGMFLRSVVDLALSDVIITKYILYISIPSIILFNFLSFFLSFFLYPRNTDLTRTGIRSS